MHGKEFFSNILNTFFVLVTLITISTFVLGMLLQPDKTFGYEAFATPVIYAACGVLPSVIMYSKRELTIKGILIRKVIQLVLVEGLILAAAFWNSEVDAGQFQYYGTWMGLSVFVVFVLVHVIDWIQSNMSAKRMTEDLLKFQRNNQQEREDCV